jgi:hypothetical protein
VEIFCLEVGGYHFASVGMVVKEQYPCYTFSYMAPEIDKPLDTSLVQQAYPHQALPPHERYGEGERYTFGATLADVYSNPPELTPVVLMRMVKGYLAVGDVLHVLPTEAGGLHVDHANGGCEIGNTGDVVSVYTAPKPEASLRMSQDGYTRKDVYGRSYTQSSLEVEGTPEGVRVVIYGVVEASPKPVTSKRGSPLQFFLVEYNPQKPEEPLKHEVWVRNAMREEVKALKLKKDDCIEAVLYRHTWEVDLQGGGTQTHTRHNLTRIIKVEKKDDAKRSKKEQTPTNQ